MCFLSIFERLHLMRLRASILSVFCLISSPVDCCLFAESPVDWLFIGCDNRMLCQAKRQKSSAHMALQEWAGRVELPYKDRRNRTKSESVCSVVAVYVYYRLLSLVAFWERLGLHAESRREVVPVHEHLDATSLGESCETSTRVSQTPSESGLLFIGYRWQSWCFFDPIRGKERVVWRTIDDHFFRRTCFLYIPFKRNVEAQLSISWLVLNQKL